MHGNTVINPLRFRSIDNLNIIMSLSIPDQASSKLRTNQSTTPDNHLKKAYKTYGPLNLFSPGLSPIHSNTNNAPIDSFVKRLTSESDIYLTEPNTKIFVQKGIAIHQSKQVSDLDTPISNFWRTRLFGPESLDESYVTVDTDLNITTQSLVYPSSSKLFQMSSEEQNKSIETLDSEYDATKISLVFPNVSIQNESCGTADTDLNITTQSLAYSTSSKLYQMSSEEQNKSCETLDSGYDVTKISLVFPNVSIQNESFATADTDLNVTTQSLVYPTSSKLYQISSEEQNKSCETLDNEMHIAKKSLLCPENDTNFNSTILDQKSESKRMRDASFDTIDSEFDVTKMSLVFPNAMLGSEYNISSHYLSEDSDKDDTMHFFGDIQNMTFGSGVHSLHSMSLLPKTATAAVAPETKVSNNNPITIKSKKNSKMNSSNNRTERIVYSDSDVISGNKNRKISYQSLRRNDKNLPFKDIPTSSIDPSKHDISSPISIGSLYTLMRDNNGQPIFVPIISYNDPLVRNASIKTHLTTTESTMDHNVMSSSSYNVINAPIIQTPIRPIPDYDPSSPHTNLHLLNQFYAYENTMNTGASSNTHSSNIQTNPLNRILFKALSSTVGHGLSITSPTKSANMSIIDHNTNLCTPKHNKLTATFHHRIVLGPTGKECLLPSSEYWKHRMLRRKITSSITNSTTNNNTYIGVGIAKYDSFSLL